MQQFLIFNWSSEYLKYVSWWYKEIDYFSQSINSFFTTIKIKLNFRDLGFWHGNIAEEKSNRDRNQPWGHVNPACDVLKEK